MAIIDIIIAVALLFGFIKGLFKGLFVEIATLVGLVAGIYGAIHFSFYAKDLLSIYLTWEPKYITFAAFAITFVGIIIIISLIGRFLTKIASLAALGLINKILGGIFGALKFAVIFSVLLGWLSKFNNIIPFLKETQIQNSLLYEPTKNLVPTIFPQLMEILEKNNIETDSETPTNEAEIH